MTGPEIDDLIHACSQLRDRLDVDKNPGMIGSPTEVVLQAAADIDALNAKLVVARELAVDLELELSVARVELALMKEGPQGQLFDCPRCGSRMRLALVKKGEEENEAARKD